MKAPKRATKSSTKKSSSKAATKNVAAKKATAKKAKAELEIGKVPALKAQELKFRYLAEAFKFSQARRTDTIHPRKVIPKVPVGGKVMDMLPSAPLNFESQVPEAALAEARNAPMVPNDTITLVKNIQLNDVATSDTASHVCEPSAAINGNVIFYTGNWFAALSIDGGSTFKYVDPYSSFPDPPGMSFCCDQVVHYIKTIDTFVWLLQYGVDNTGKNIQRIAYATTAKVKTGSWKYFDITPASLGLGPGIWLDFPDLANGANSLYMTTNCFKGNNWVNTAVVRIKLTSFTTGTMNATKALSNRYFSFRVSQNSGTTAYFAAHKSTSVLIVFAWKETSASPTASDVTVASWAAGTYRSITPDGRDWLRRADPRLGGATLVGNEVWFAWGANKGGANLRPNPFVQIARINVSTMTLIENINLWDPSSAICYAALGTNSNNEVGVTYVIGGGPLFPTNVVGILTGTRRQVTTFASNRGPADNKWGDYLTVRRNYTNQKLFFAAGYSLLSGAGNSDATPNMTVFGRSSDV